MIKLKGRLLQIANMVDSCNKLADIGTDHAYIPIYLFQNGVCNKVIATDIKEEPLKKAASNINKHKLTGMIELRLGDGIKPIKDDECDAFIIAGLGGLLISEILENSQGKVKKAKYIILQPMYTEEVLREYLLTSGFNISSEVLVYDEKRIYVVIKASYDGVKRIEEPLYYHIGKPLFDNRDPLLKRYLERKIRIQTKIVQGLKQSENKDREQYFKEQEVLIQLHEAYTASFK
ncbi:MAG: class I SAM-dependent methyltransferase [Ruminiclostridium sp.]|nr:class I SAM-dependent methyltransferase [Ruminiclostridium sp.]